MTSARFAERWKELEPLLDAAIDLPEESREAFLDEACGGDSELKDELKLLLVEYQQSDSLIDQPVAQTFASLIRDLAGPPSDLIKAGYRIERELGRGGMATVYLAHDVRHDRKVAVKILHPERAAAFRAERFLAEIRMTARLHHPHILPLHDSGAADDILFYVMPYVDGETLRQRLQREKQLPIGDVARITREVASALDSAHRQGVIHRDIKPENILLGDGGAMVADFGIALAVTAASAQPSAVPAQVAGTPRYMSPEQASGDRPIDGRSDVYSLAAVSYEMLGSKPPRGADAVIARALAREPEARHATASEFAEGLERALVAGDDSEITRATEAAAALGRRRRRQSVALIIGVAATTAAVFGATRLRHKNVESTLFASPVSADASRSTSRQTRNLTAYDFYQEALDPALTRSDSGARLAIRYLHQAIAVDSTYAAAYAELAHMYVIASLGASSPGLSRAQAVAMAKASAAKAVSLDDSLADAHSERAFVSMHGVFDMQLAATELRRALALDPAGRRPHEYLAYLYEWTERPFEALAEVRRANAADPLSVASSIELASALYFTRQYDDALAQLDKLRSVRPPIRRVRLIAGSIYVMKKKWPEAIAEFRAQSKVAGKDVVPGAFLGRTFALAGKRDSARKILSTLIASSQQGEGAFGVAIVYEGLGDYDNAFAWLNRSIDDHSLWLNIMGPMFDNLRADPRFDRIRRRLNEEGPRTHS